MNSAILCLAGRSLSVNVVPSSSRHQYENAWSRRARCPRRPKGCCAQNHAALSSLLPHRLEIAARHPACSPRTKGSPARDDGFNESRREEGTAARADCQKAAALAICAMRLRREPRRHALSAAARHAGRPGPGWRTAAFFAAEIWSSGGDAGIECAFILEWPRRAGSDGTAVRFGFRLREVRACWIICVVLPCR